MWNVGSLKQSSKYIKNKDKTKNPELDEPQFYSLRAVLDYAANSDKTEQQYFVSGVNCSADYSYQEMLTVKTRFGKHSGRRGYHGVQSFAEGEVTPEIAHEIGCELARRMWGEDFQVLVTTHLNTAHLHNHFVVNSVSCADGRKFRNTPADYARLRKLSDELCREYNLSVVEKSTGRAPRSIVEAEKRGAPTRKVILKEAVDEALAHARSMREFKFILRDMGYFLDDNPNHKHWTARQSDWKQSIRLSSLGGEYTPEAITKLLASVPKRPKPRYNPRPRTTQYIKQEPSILAHTSLFRAYRKYCYLLGVFPKRNIRPTQVPPPLRDDLLHARKIIAQAKYLAQYKIETTGELAQRKTILTEKKKELESARRCLQNEIRRVGSTEQERVELRGKVTALSEEIRKIKQEVKLCEDIEARSRVMRERLNRVDTEEKQISENDKNKNTKEYQ
jgi:hypothetical protein